MIARDLDNGSTEDGESGSPKICRLRRRKGAEAAGPVGKAREGSPADLQAGYDCGVVSSLPLAQSLCLSHQHTGWPSSNFVQVCATLVPWDVNKGNWIWEVQVSNKFGKSWVRLLNNHLFQQDFLEPLACLCALGSFKRGGASKLPKRITQLSVALLK